MAEENLPMPKPNVKIIVPNQPGAPVAPSMVDDAISIRRQKVAEKLALSMGGGDGGSGGGDPIANVIVGKAMDNFEKAEIRFHEAAKESAQDAAAAGAALQIATEKLYAVQVEQLTGALGKMEKNLDEMKKGNQPKTAIAVVNEAREVMEALGKTPGGQPVQPVSTPQDNKITIELQQMTLSHELAMKRLELEILEMKNRQQLTLAEFTDNRVRKDREFDDSKKFRSDAVAGITDVLASVSQSISKDMAGVGTTATNRPRVAVKEAVTEATAAQPAVEETHEAAVKAFNCEYCETPIAVPDGGGSVSCPNEECGAQFNVKMS